MSVGKFGMLYRSELSEVCKKATFGEVVIYCTLVSLRNGRTGKTEPLKPIQVMKLCGCSKSQYFHGVAALVRKEFLTKEATGRKDAHVFGFPLLPPEVHEDASQ